MKLTLKNVQLERVVARKSGVSAKTGNAWEQETLLINAKNGQYDNKMVVSLFGHDKINEFHQVADGGGLFDCDIYIDVTEWNGKVFNDLSMGAFNPVSSASHPVQVTPKEEDDDLPDFLK